MFEHYLFFFLMYMYVFICSIFFSIVQLRRDMIDQKEGETNFAIKIHYDNMVSENDIFSPLLFKFLYLLTRIQIRFYILERKNQLFNVDAFSFRYMHAETCHHQTSQLFLQIDRRNAIFIGISVARRLRYV